ncbi:MAG: nucleotidyltransferase domain-containing protein [Anaerolineae bacterium]|jgi:predicted nucleotidyltransferase|nr:nucleotidyltransferase domain-containing protein [Anaerolineae bacterium]MDH7473451.1 nucleotidyltransferase domain-containing protein [Anaerolineae bacterium]
MSDQGAEVIAPVAPQGFQPVTHELLQQVTRRIVEAFNPEKIILFGSYAYGTPTSDSDVDILIVMESDEKPAKRHMAVSQLFRNRPFPMDIVVRTPQEISHRLAAGDFFLREIMQRGKVLYERNPG